MCCGLVNGKFGYFRSLVNAGFFANLYVWTCLF